jgi:site-specific recombinase XerD
MWNQDKQEVYTRCPNWNTINADIARYRMKAEKLRIAADEDGELISVYEFEQIFRAGAKDIKDIFSFIEEDIKQFGNTYAPDTIKMYESQARKLKRFCNTLSFNEINPFFWKRYDSHMISLGNNPNTRWKAFRFIKTFLNKAIENGLMKSDPLKYIKVKKPDGNRMVLTMEELRALEDLYMAIPSGKLKTVLKYFLFACFTGMRYQDIKDIKHSNLHLEHGNPYALFIQHKTKEPLTLPLNKKALSYVSSEGLPNNPVFMVYSIQYTDRLLKEIMELAKIHKSISFHCSRHTCASILQELGGDILTTSKLLGQRKLSTTQLYTRVSESAKRNLMEMMEVI